MVAAFSPTTMSDDLPARPPAKRPRHTHAPPRTGLESAIFANGHGRKLTAATTKIPGSLKHHHLRVDEARAVVATADGHGDVDMPDAGKTPVVEISSDSDSSKDSEGEDEDEDEDDQEEGESGNGVANGDTNPPDTQGGKLMINGRKRLSVDPDDESDRSGDEGGEDASDGAEQEDPSFGDLLRLREAEPVDIEASFATADQDPSAVAQLPRFALSGPSATSLGTVLTQALHTNDNTQLERCLQVHDLSSVRATIERLPSNLVGSLLHKLAERMHKRPGRAGNLMVWVQWSLVAHGGYLASQPGVMAKLGSLHRVINERASGLQSLLHLKGKLDMLSAQLELRKSMQRAAGASSDGADEPVIYVEGEEESSEDDVEEGMDNMIEESMHGKSKRSRSWEEAEESSEDEEMPLINGVAHEEKESDASEDEDEDEFIDDEAEEASEDDEISEEDMVDEPHDEDVSDSEEEPSAPPKRSITTKLGLSRT